MAQAEACYHHALAIARCQQAKSWELRTAMSLGAAVAAPGQAGRRPRVTGPIYGWFTEGFDTADLQEARALLETLDRGPASQ